jgi:hypothetical protein
VAMLAAAIFFSTVANSKGDRCVISIAIKLNYTSLIFLTV